MSGALICPDVNAGTTIREMVERAMRRTNAPVHTRGIQMPAKAKGEFFKIRTLKVCATT